MTDEDFGPYETYIGGYEMWFFCGECQGTTDVKRFDKSDEFECPNCGTVYRVKVRQDTDDYGDGRK